MMTRIIVWSFFSRCGFHHFESKIASSILYRFQNREFRFEIDLQVRKEKKINDSRIFYYEEKNVSNPTIGVVLPRQYFHAKKNVSLPQTTLT